MLKAVIELSKYILAINILLYTLISYVTLRREDRERRTVVFVLQDMMIFVNHIVGSLVLLYSRQDFSYLFLALLQVIAVFTFLVLMRAIYPSSDRLILNHIAMLLSISFVILTRLSYARSLRQFVIVAVSLIIALIIPVFVKHVSLIKRCEWLYVTVGIAILGAVLVSGRISNGSKLAFSVFGISFQPSEFVKIIYVLFLAGILSRAKHFGHIFLSAVLAAAHVLILVASKDLGSALIFFVTYVVLLYVSTRKARYLILGLAGAAAASYVSYFLFAHVRVRVAAWLDPWTDIDATGYQIAQSLFGIGTGGWFGMGIDAGTPGSIPYVEQDFIFSAICEEYGVVFGICLIAICVNLFLEIVNIAHSCRDSFVRHSVYGLGIVYIMQIFLTIGGNSKFVPLTGVTLPLISYGGSSVLATLMMFAVVQGFYIYREPLPETDAGAETEDAEIPCAPRLQMNLIAGAFTLAFAAIGVYLTHYVHFDSTEVINNSYNAKRQEILASQTIRGDILSADGEVLATTRPDTEERYYPYGEVFAHAVGYAANGRMGVEQSANIYLVSSNISLNNKLLDDLENEKHMGNTVITTFDARLQKIAYNALGLYEGAIVITDPATGRILALVSKPDFDPNEITQIWDSLLEDTESSVLVNRVTQGMYPPGSTFKILTALEYIRENPADYQNYSFQCDGSFTNGDYAIKCYHGARHGNVDFTTAFAKSCNSAFADISLRLDRKSFSKTLESLYFNREFPADFPVKQSSISREIAESDNDMIQTAIGQGITQITPLQMAMITGMIANDGEMMQPYMIERIETADGTTLRQFTPTSLGQLISEEEATALKELMHAVVEEGTGTRFKGAGYSAAGKTGSAEYNSNSDSHAWFTGFTYDTEMPLQITIIMEGAGSGGEYAVPVARRILEQYYAQ
ncbi:MAG: penicillin-binding transpeptidase domain-containing protein [Roseburia sp.]|nr:penicillin-binding transpeptidase domain-containing protein [Roseburia sp.]